MYIMRAAWFVIRGPSTTAEGTRPMVFVASMAVAKTVVGLFRYWARGCRTPVCATLVQSL